jgi:plasmid stability protein
MARLLVRDFPRDVVEALNRQAALNGRSAEAEHRAILETALNPARERFWDRAARLRVATKGKAAGCSADLIRPDSDAR